MKSLNFRKYLLLIGIGLIIVGFILAPYDQFKTDIKPNKISFLSKNDEITITGNLYLPENYISSEYYPAVILVHGINDKAERYHHAAIEFVRRNFIALAINLRGHADSEGMCTLSALEPWDIMGAADFLLNNYNISNLGVVGHSLGGMSVIRAAHNDTRFNATVVMAPPVSIDLLLARIISDPDYLLQYQWLLSFHFNLADPYEQFIRSPVFWINQTSPNNFFYVLGGADDAATVDEALLCIKNKTGLSSVAVNTTYGDFGNGTRAQLRVYPGVTHVAEPTTPAIIRDTILWMEGAFNITNGDLSLDDLIQWNFGTIWSQFIMGGFVICISPGISYICTSILKSKRIERPKIGKELEPKKKFMSLGIYTSIFIVSSALTFPIIESLNYASWSRYNVAGLLANILTVQGFFLAIALIVIIYFERRIYKASWIDFGLNKATTLRAIMISIVISAFLIFGYFFLPYLTTSYIHYPRYWGPYLLIFLNYLFIAIIGEFYLRGLLQTKWFKEGKRIRNWFNIFLIALLGGIIQGVAVLFILLPFDNFTFSYAGFTLDLFLIGLIGGIILFFILGLLSSWIFHKTQHILPAAVVQAVFMSWFLVTFITPL